MALMYTWCVVTYVSGAEEHESLCQHQMHARALQQRVTTAARAAGTAGPSQQPSRRVAMSLRHTNGPDLQQLSQQPAS